MPTATIAFDLPGTEGPAGPKLKQQMKAFAAWIARRDEASTKRAAELAAFNRQLSSGYLANVEAMVDVSNLLNQYASFFNVLSEHVKRTAARAAPEAEQDVRSLEAFTRAKIHDLSGRFVSQVQRLEGLYRSMGADKELRTLASARLAFEDLQTKADRALAALTSLTQKGGAPPLLKKERLKKRDLNAGAVPRTHPGLRASNGQGGSGILVHVHRKRFEET
jgi:hypothetical protein